MTNFPIINIIYFLSLNYQVVEWLELVTMSSDKATKYILQLVKFDRLYILTFQRTSLQEIQFKMVKISIFFVLVAVAVLFVAGNSRYIAIHSFLKSISNVWK
jgi:hypothetical protein